MLKQWFIFRRLNFNSYKIISCSLLPYLLNMVLKHVIFIFVHCIHARFVRIPDLSKIVYVWQCVDMLQNVECTLYLLLLAQLEDAAFLVFYITESDRICRTCLLASCACFTIP